MIIINRTVGCISNWKQLYNSNEYSDFKEKQIEIIFKHTRNNQPQAWNAFFLQF